MKRELRFVSSEIRAEQAEGEPIKLRWYPAVFDQSTDLGPFTESIARGAFADSLRKDDIRALIDHDPSLILARSSGAVDSNLVLREDETGLYAEATPPDTTRVHDLIKDIRAKNITGGSFGFILEKSEDQSWERFSDGRKAHRTIKRVKLFDVSIVSYPAYASTERYGIAVRGLPYEVRSLEEIVAEAQADFDPELFEKRKNHLSFLDRSMQLQKANLI